MDAIYYSNQRPKHVTSEISAKRSRLCSSLAPYHVSRHISYYTMCLGEQSLYLVAGSRTRTGLWLGALGFASITTCAIRSTACTTAPGTRNLQRKTQTRQISVFSRYNMKETISVYGPEKMQTSQHGGDS